MIIRLLLAFLTVAILPVGAENGTGRRITYDMSGLPLTITSDGLGLYQLEGLPYPGQILYQRSTGVVFYQHPEDPEWLAVQPTQISAAAVSATITAGPKWQPWPAVGSPQPTQRWDVKAENQPATCDEYFASPSAAQMAGLDAADLSRILATVQWLNAGTFVSPCEGLVLSAAQGAKIGLPILFSGPNGPWQLQEVVTTAVAPIPVPAAIPLSEDARLQLLLIQFSPEERTSLLEKYDALPVTQQIEAISSQLNVDSLP